MLENLEQINWSELTHAHGSAHNVPSLIRSIPSADDTQAKRLFRLIYDHLYHQGTIYEASVATVPFLIELLTVENKQKARTVKLLHDLSHGNCWGPNRFWKWDQDAQDAVNKGFEIYLNLLSDSDETVRLEIVSLLTSSPRFINHDVGRILDNLIQKLHQETVSAVRIEIIKGLGCLFIGYVQEIKSRKDEIIQLIDVTRKTDEDVNCRIAARLVLPQLLQEKTPQHIIDDLLEDLVNARGVRIEGFFGDLSGNALNSIGYINWSRQYSTLTKAMPRIKDNEFALEMASALLYWTLGGIGSGYPISYIRYDSDRKAYFHFKDSHKRLDITSLNDAYKQTLKAIINADNLWESKHNLLEAYGLPGDRNEVRKLLEK